MLTLKQAIRNAVEAERAAHRYYLDLVERAADSRVRGFFAKMAKQELEHAAAIEAMAERLVSGELPAGADDPIDGVETIPGWRNADSISLTTAIDLAISAEHSASLYYDAIADYFTGINQRFFRDLAAAEQEHAEMLVELRDEFSQTH